MAIKPLENEAFYREVDEELRREQLSQFWQRYGWWAIGGILLVLAAIGGYLFWQNQRHAKAAEQGEALIQALEDIETGQRQRAAEPINELASSSLPGYRAAALFSRANIAVEAGNMPAAIATLREIAGDESLAEPYRTAALVRQTALEYDQLPPAVVIQRLAPIARAGNAWFGTAGEMVAVAYLRQRQPERAAPIFAAIARDEAVPETIRSRAVQMAGALGVDATQQQGGQAGGAPAAAPAGQQPQAGTPQPAAPAAEPAAPAATEE